MIDEILEGWFNRAIRINLVCGMYSLNGDTISPAQMTITFHQYDMTEYLKFSSYIKEYYGDFEKIVQINQKENDKIDLLFTFKGDTTIEFGVNNAECNNFIITDFFARQKKDKPINLYPNINTNVEVLLELSDKDPDLKVSQPIHIHRWYGTPFGTSSRESTTS